MFCSNCGKENADVSKFCFHCGVELRNNIAHKSEVKKAFNASVSDPKIMASNSTGKLKLIIIGALSILVLGYGFMSTLNKPISEKSSSGGGYSYEPNVISLKGLLITTKGEDPDGKLVRFYALKLIAPIKVNGSKSDPMNSETVNDVSVIQLTGDDVVMRKIKSDMGQNVNLTGTLFHSHTGNHFTSVLMSVQTIN